uniref:Ornithine carbamoyltransferase, mitochondrial n=1 Tax=Neurospora crassa TaxID=5141 RepID=Q9P440_NEUCS|nr:carbamoylphosphate:L-ornithine carbamoyltransferase precursor [Neurospora crassa]
MMSRATTRTIKSAVGQIQARSVSNSAASSTPRHLLSISQLSPAEFSKLVLNASAYKQATKAAFAAGPGQVPRTLDGKLKGRTVAMMFSKRTTRTRVSTEAAVASWRGHPMFLGKDDIQLGVNESLYDTSKVISSMTSCMVARVGPHSDVADLARDSSVPVINALSDDFHPLQAIADFQTIHEAFAPSPPTRPASDSRHEGRLGRRSNNVLFDMATAASCWASTLPSPRPPATDSRPHEADHPQRRRGLAKPGKLIETTVPEEAVKDADILVTDTWVSMGQEAETQRRLKDCLPASKITNELAKRGGAKPGWKFMHCLPRHPEEVDDEVFYGPQSLVFPEAENRLWAAVSALEAFVVNNGRIL